MCFCDPNLGICVFCLALLCWVSFIGVLHEGRFSCCMALIWAFLLVLVFSCAGSPSLVYCTEFGCVAWP